ncbi:glycosyltransferase family 4 protein [Mycobacterium sp. ITM-2016-00317]|uniref:glycosyltransferase family 4 protein n=1 Tax=Mycobacterium sp. ITM-2016-00317 TaxID=2099694 RepID=UPI00287FCB18|nr:glycosyltransferase family 4 protein [Mycobacterium sp. ITM-2016-00317]WNG86970.1 glycosyltransferase family 4 protein [Mycobacterium sp. ITM-2016-00317]
MDAGKKVVLAGILEYLIERVGRENVHYVMVGGDTRPDFPVRLHPVAKPHPLAAVGSALARTGTGRASLQESLLGTGAVRRDIHRTLDLLAPATEIYDTVRMAQHAPEDVATKQICYLDDLFSERYGSMLSAAKRFPDVNVQPLGNFAAHVPQVLRPLAEHPVGQQALLRLEQRLVRRSEDRTADRFDTTLLINEQEAGRLRQRCGTAPGRIHAIPPLLAPRRPQTKREYRGAPDFVFLGQLSLPHNDDGLRDFLRRVWPLVLAARPDARLRVVGRHPLPALRESIAQTSGSVTLEGFVPDLSGLFNGSAALINPLRFGSGVKLKIIEALGAGVPVVSTRVGADGVETGPGMGVLVGDGDAGLAELLLSVTDTRFNRRLSAEAAEHFSMRYSRRAVFDCYDAAFGFAPISRQRDVPAARVIGHQPVELRPTP